MKLFKFILFCIVFYVLVINPYIIYWIEKMDTPFKLHFIFGKMGTGKTGIIAIDASKDLLDPNFKRVYTSVGIPGTYKFDPKMIGKGFTFPPYSSVYIDEFGLIYNSRDFKTFPKEARRWFKYLRQSRCKVTIFSQAPDADKSIRDLAHDYSILNRFGPFTINWYVSKNIDVGSDSDGNGQLVDNYMKLGILGFKIYYLPRYFGLWETNDPPKMPIIDSEFIPHTPALLRSYSFIKWSRFNYKVVYEGLFRRVSAAKSAVHAKLLKNTFILDYRKFMYIMRFSFQNPAATIRIKRE